MNGVFGHGDLRLYLLSLLAEHPRHGYELIQALSERFGGTYSPSAGTIYPRLAKLEDEGLVTKSTDGRKTVYAITDAGLAELAARHDELDSIENNVTDSVRMLADAVRANVNDAMRSLRADLAAAARASRPDPREAAADSEVNYGFPAIAATPSYTAPARESGTVGQRDAFAGSSDGSGGAAQSTHSSDTASAEDAGVGSSADGRYGASGSAEQRRLNAEAVRDIENALASFRASVRTDVRLYAARGPIAPSAVAQFTERLASIHADLKRALGT